MTIQPAVKEDLKGVKGEGRVVSRQAIRPRAHGREARDREQDRKAPRQVEGYDNGLHERFVLWKDQTGNSVNQIAGMIGRSAAAVSQYVNFKYEGNIAEVEKDIANLLQREEDLEFTTRPVIFCHTQAAKLIWEVFQFCDENCDMGIVVGNAGSGKTVTCNEYKRANRGTIFITADIATRLVGSVLRMLAKKLGSTPAASSNSALLHTIIDRVKNSRRLIIIDEAHFLTWDAFEVIRKIHDCAGVGVVYVGMPRTFDQMKGTSNKAFLFDQIYSRISIKRDYLPVEKDDIRMLADSLCPGLDSNCIEYLLKKAQGKGKLRTVAKLLQVAMTMHRGYDQPMSLELLETAAQFLMKS